MIQEQEFVCKIDLKRLYPKRLYNYRCKLQPKVDLNEETSKEIMAVQTMLLLLTLIRLCHLIKS